VIMVRRETSPKDIHGCMPAEGILTPRPRHDQGAHDARGRRTEQGKWAASAWRDDPGDVRIRSGSAGTLSVRGTGERRAGSYPLTPRQQHRRRKGRPREEGNAREIMPGRRADGAARASPANSPS